MTDILEKEIQSAILDIARLFGWRVYHTFDSRKSEAGFPDLVLVRDRVIYAEVKRDGQRPRPSQIDWLNALSRAGAEVYVWTESDYDEVASVLSQRVPRPETAA